MTLKLYFHPLASFCWKPLIALYENAAAFEPVIVNLGDEASRTAFAAVWPLAKMPVLRDEARDCTVAESSIVVEYLDAHYPGGTRLLPEDPDRAWRARMWDRVFDHYVQEPMQKIVIDRLRPSGKSDAFGVEQAEMQIRGIYDFLDRSLGTAPWMTGGDFTLADCSAAPALFYANTVVPIDSPHKKLPAYLDRLMERASFARVLEEAEPYFEMFPLERKPQITRVAG